MSESPGSRFDLNRQYPETDGTYSCLDSASENVPPPLSRFNNHDDKIYRPLRWGGSAVPKDRIEAPRVGSLAERLANLRSGAAEHVNRRHGAIRSSENCKLDGRFAREMLVNYEVRIVAPNALACRVGRCGTEFAGCKLRCGVAAVRQFCDDVRIGAFEVRRESADSVFGRRPLR